MLGVLIFRSSFRTLENILVSIYREFLIFPQEYNGLLCKLGYAVKKASVFYSSKMVEIVVECEKSEKQ